jgi:hypothetical protein
MEQGLLRILGQETEEVGVLPEGQFADDGSPDTISCTKPQDEAIRPQRHPA